MVFCEFFDVLFMIGHFGRLDWKVIDFDKLGCATLFHFKFLVATTDLGKECKTDVGASN